MRRDVNEVGGDKRGFDKRMINEKERHHSDSAPSSAREGKDFNLVHGKHRIELERTTPRDERHEQRSDKGSAGSRGGDMCGKAGVNGLVMRHKRHEDRRVADEYVKQEPLVRDEEGRITTEVKIEKADELEGTVLPQVKVEEHEDQGYENLRAVGQGTTWTGSASLVDVSTGDQVVSMDTGRPGGSREVDRRESQEVGPGLTEGERRKMKEMARCLEDLVEQVKNALTDAHGTTSKGWRTAEDLEVSGETRIETSQDDQLGLRGERGMSGTSKIDGIKVHSAAEHLRSMGEKLNEVMGIWDKVKESARVGAVGSGGTRSDPKHGEGSSQGVVEGIQRGRKRNREELVKGGMEGV